MAIFNITSNIGIITAFSVSTLTGDGCSSPDLSPYDLVLYHNGINTLPIIGDLIFTTSDGLNFMSTVALLDHQLTDLSYLKVTGGDGKRENLGC